MTTNRETDPKLEELRRLDRRRKRLVAILILAVGAAAAILQILLRR